MTMTTAMTVKEAIRMELKPVWSSENVLVHEIGPNFPGAKDGTPEGYNAVVRVWTGDATNPGWRRVFSSGKLYSALDHAIRRAS